ncbi:MAG: PIN domain-containing protein [Treponema sp.]|nr:PIN domain-containing protein [Treponema sp.]
MIYLLDTNILSEGAKISPSKKVLAKIEENLDYSVISSITWAELLTGVKILDQGQKKEALLSYMIENVQKIFDILPFDSHCAAVYSDLAEKLKNSGRPAPAFDLMIASTAIANGLILVTRNTKDFKNIAEVSSLCLENWFEGSIS